MLTESQQFEIRQLKRRKYKAPMIARMIGATEQAVREHLAAIRERPSFPKTSDPTPEEIRARCEELKAKHLADLKASQYRPALEHGPKYYIVVPKGLK